MTDKNNINWNSMSDAGVLTEIGRFIKHHRLEQNKTQNRLAHDAGINRSTLSELENGNRSNTLTFIQLLRALDLLYVLDAFQIHKQISPLKLAALDQATRERASKSKKEHTGQKKNSDW